MPILAVHDEIVVECGEEDAQKAEVWLKKAMIDGRDELLNPPRPRSSPRADRSRSEKWHNLGRVALPDLS